MALRVLLADNSETIKKVIQLTLQDFAVDLRIVASGLDVIDAVEKFKPDIIFVDILLQKKTGYEVARDLKQHPTLGSIPVILMWSGFMEFDETRAQASLADARLEKPFDAKTLRDLVTQFVGKAKNNPLANFLDFPELPPAEAQPAKNSRTQDPLEDLQKIKKESLKFAQNLKPQSKSETIHLGPTLKEDLPVLDLELNDVDEDFEIQGMSNNNSFKLDIPDDVSEDNEFSVDMDKIDKVDDMSFLLNPEASKITPPPTPPPAKQAPAPAPQPKQAPAPVAKPQQVMPSPALPSLSESDIEKIVNQRVQDIVEKVVWQVVPEMASQMVRKELERLLKEKDT